MPGPLTLQQIAAQLGGRIAGDPGILIRGVASLAAAREGDIAFLATPRYRRQLAATRASAVILGPEAEAWTALPRIVAENPYAYFARVSQLFNALTVQPPGVHPAATVAAGARLGARVSIGAGCVIGEGVEIGEASTLYPGVVVYPGCRIGARAIVHSGTVIGADGFGFAADGGRWIKIPQIGRVVIGDDVEIGAACSIDRGALEDTVIEDGVKLDNQIQIGHNCRIGAHTAMAGCAAVAGSTRIGRHCAIGAGALILGHLEICDHVRVSAHTVVSRSIRRPGTYTGVYPFDEHDAWARNAALARHLAALARRVRELEKRLQAREGGDG
ncbi:MAG: UDP-3-O-(3-hydroxymyristoyl)glucosamine N-acyltransferase [Burkholderiales bacterium]|nr:UDP-3-O-(3-hydroxymyristoyl)glucosamine N-acyltransferase [Burkholderiales bacterium]